MDNKLMTVPDGAATRETNPKKLGAFVDMLANFRSTLSVSIMKISKTRKSSFQLTQLRRKKKEQNIR